MKQLPLLILLALAVPARGQERVDFKRQVLPILERNCWSCHQAATVDARGVRHNPSAGLRLDGRDWIRKGGDDGLVLTPGKPDQSPLYTRTVLPADDDERMPKDAAPLGREQTELLRRWILDGAEFGTWQGAADAPAAPTAGSQPAVAGPVPAGLDAGLTPPTADLLRQCAGSKARIEPIGSGSALLRVSFPGSEDQVRDSDLAALAPLAAHVTQLVLARAKVTDAGLQPLAKMPRLTLLDLRETEIGDAGLAALAGLSELRVLNLYSTKVTDAAVATLGKLARLTALHVWDTDITPAGLQQLRGALPHAHVTGPPELPGADPAGAPRRGRGRKK